MQLFTPVLLLALTVLGASAWPRLAEETSLMRMVLDRLGAPLAEARGISPAESACVNKYINATSKIADELAKETNKCEEAANRTLVANSKNTNATVNQIRSQELTLEKQLRQCLNETDNQRFINCTVSTFDKNLQLLDSSNSLAYTTQSQFTSNSSLVATQRSSCISAAVSASKVKSIEAANDFDGCMFKVPNQRELAAQQPQQQEPQKVEQQVEQEHEQEQEQEQEQKPEQERKAEQPAKPAKRAQPAQLAQPAQPAQPLAI